MAAAVHSGGGWRGGGWRGGGWRGGKGGADGNATKACTARMKISVTSEARVVAAVVSTAAAVKQAHIHTHRQRHARTSLARRSLASLANFRKVSFTRRRPADGTRPPSSPSHASSESISRPLDHSGHLPTRRWGVCARWELDRMPPVQSSLAQGLGPRGRRAGRRARPPGDSHPGTPFAFYTPCGKLPPAI